MGEVILCVLISTNEQTFILDLRKKFFLTKFMR